MSNVNLRTITNNFTDGRLVSLKSWRQASEIVPRDKGGPYVFMQEGYDPGDMMMQPDEFVLGRSGKWLSLAYFFKLPVPDRREEFVFGTAAEVMKTLGQLASKVEMHGQPASLPDAPTPEDEEMAAAFRAGMSGEARNG